MSVPGSANNTGGGWSVGQPRTTDLLQLANCMLAGASIGVDTAAVAQSSPSTDQIIGIVGQDMQRTQIIAMTLFNRFETQLASQGEWFAGWVAGAPAGFELQITGLVS